MKNLIGALALMAAAASHAFAGKLEVTTAISRPIMFVLDRETNEMCKIPLTNEAQNALAAKAKDYEVNGVNIYLIKDTATGICLDIKPVSK